MRRGHLQRGVCAAAVVVVLAAAGCTGTEFLTTGNQTVAFELTLTGTTDQPYDCVTWGFVSIRIRPLDGTCGTDSANAGEPCLGTTDCDPLPPLPGEPAVPGTCEGSKAGELIGNDGIFVEVDEDGGTVNGQPCEQTLAAGAGVCLDKLVPVFGRCSGRQFVCSDDQDCQLLSGGTCEPRGACAVSQTICLNDAACEPPTCVRPDGLCSAQAFTVPTTPCQQDADCAGTLCFFGQCEAPPAVCTQDLDCPQLLPQCVMGQCAKKTCTVNSDCQQGGSQVATQCVSGQCNRFCNADATCQPIQATCGFFNPGHCSGSGDSCSFSSRCPSGQVCRPGACLASPIDLGCSNDQDCANPCLPDGQDSASCITSADCRFCNGGAERCDSDTDCQGGGTCFAALLCENEAEGDIPTEPLVLPTPLVLSPGLYEIASVIVDSVSLYADAPQPPLTPPGSLLRRCGSSVDLHDTLGDALRFIVPEQGGKPLRLVIDLGALEDNLPDENECGPFETNVPSIVTCGTCDG